MTRSKAIIIIVIVFLTSLATMVYFFAKKNKIWWFSEEIIETRVLTPKEQAAARVQEYRRQISEIEQKDVTENGGLTDGGRDAIINLHNQITITEAEALTAEEREARVAEDIERQKMIDKINAEILANQNK